MKFVASVSLIIMSLILTGISETKVNQETIAGMWLFDEGGGNTAKDSSGNGNDGEIMNAPKSVDGKFGTALEFDGKDDYVLIPSSSTLDPKEGDMTYTAWVKTTGAADLYVYHNPSTGSEKSEWRVNNGKIRLYVRDSGGANTWRDSASTLNDGKWHLIATIWKGTESPPTIDYYLDGVLDNAAAYGNQGIVKGTNLQFPGDDDAIGIRLDGMQRHFNGSIDEFAIFNVALTEGDIKNIMTRGLKSISAVSTTDKLPRVWGRHQSSIKKNEAGEIPLPFAGFRVRRCIQ